MYIIASLRTNTVTKMANDKKMQLEAAFLSVLAQPTRLKILCFLRDGERCACEINPGMQEDPSVVSRHLVKMKEAGILESRKQGVSIYYRIKESAVFAILEMVDEILLKMTREQAKTVEGIF